MSITLWQYYLDLAHSFADNAFGGIETLADWESQREQRHREFMKSMGLEPSPDRCDPVVEEVGTVEGEGYVVRKLAFQILPDCWATSCLFLPNPLPEKKLPGVLYVCGHSGIGVLGYHTHAVMWARRGYGCLVLDTIEQHDNPGDHHGLYYGTDPEWVSMGYTAAGGELWNSIRALDVLASRPEIDADRIGTTGNSGGGAASFFLAIADPRIKAVATACGVTVPGHTLDHRHLMHHCDCMYAHNPFQRDTSEFAALIAPRPVIFCFAREDVLFSPAEFRGMAERTKRIYRLYDREDACRLFEYEGPHGYRPKTVEAINRWFDEHVAGEDRPTLERGTEEQTERAMALFNGRPPASDKLAVLPELLTPLGSVELPQGEEDWPSIRSAAVRTLREDVFHAFDRMNETMEVEVIGEWLQGETPYKNYRGRIGGMNVWFEISDPPKAGGAVVVGLANQDENVHGILADLGALAQGNVIAAVEPRGSGFTSAPDGQRNFFLRAGAITGITPVMLMIRDLQEVISYLRSLPEMEGREVVLFGRGDAAVACIYTAVLDETVAGVVAEGLPKSHRRSAQVLGILRTLDIDHAVGLLAPRPVGLAAPTHYRMSWARRVYGRLGCPERLVVAQAGVGKVLRGVIERPPAAQ